MIIASVYTNQDNVICHVNKFLELPRKGDKVAVKHKGKLIFSEVRSIWHDLDVQGNPTVEIELWSENIHRLNSY